MASSNRIEITRADFTRLYGIAPSPDLCGMCLLNADRTEIVAEYVFVEQLNPSTRAEISSLERLYALPCNEQL
jgi:hypothetical protein